MAFFVKKWVKILIVPSYGLKFDDVTVTLYLIVLSGPFFFTKLTCYFLTPYQDLLRLNVIFMVRKIGKKKVHWVCPNTLPLSNFRDKTVGLI